MFRKKEEPTEQTTGRYRCELVHPLGKKGAIDDVVQRALDEGDSKGWRLINVTQHQIAVLLFWDTEIPKPQ